MDLPLRISAALLAVLLGLALPLPSARGAETEDVPAPATEADTLDTLVARARAHQADTEALLRRYSWMQRETLVVRKPSGEVVRSSRRTLRVFPVQGGAVVDLIDVDGRAPTRKELARVEKQNARAMKEAADRASAPPDDEPAAEDDASGALLELLSRTRYEIVGRQVEDGRELVGIAFEPDPRAPGEGVERKLLRHSRGTVWLDAETAQPVHGAAGAADKFRVKGLIGVKDFSLEAEQVRVGGEIWLPSRFRFEGEVSVLGARRLIESEVLFSEYTRASVDVDEQVAPMPAPAPAR